jgi:hypothetical protein
VTETSELEGFLGSPGTKELRHSPDVVEEAPSGMLNVVGSSFTEELLYPGEPSS